MRTPGVVVALRSIALAPDNVIDGIDLAVAVVIAGQRSADQGAGVEQEGAGAVGKTAGAVVVIATAGAQAGVGHASSREQRPLCPFGRIVGVEPEVQVDHVPVHAGYAGVEESVLRAAG